MNEILLVILVVILIALAVMQLLLLCRKISIDLLPVQQAFKSVEDSYSRNERTVREEIAQNRKEISAALGLSREEMSKSLKIVCDTLITSVGEMAKLQKSQLDVFSERLDKLTQSSDEKLTAIRTTVDEKLAKVQEDGGKRLDHLREDSAASSQKLREEIGNSLKGFGDSMVKTLGELGSGQRTQLGNVVEQLTKLTEATEKRLDAQRLTVDERLKGIQEDSGSNAKQLREEVGNTLKSFNDSVLKGMTGMAEAQRNQMEGFSKQLGSLIESNQQRLDALKLAVEEKLKGIQEDNAKQLDQMRQTVDEKLQGTLEKRLGESFKQVSERLEAVHKGLGEMQTLATGVGDLKRVLTNVKSRGTWGEVQLGAMLEEVLTPDQYARNVSTKDEGERVEFAIKLPGRSDDANEIVWLPIDAKFPVEDYQRLINAQEQADAETAEVASKQLENRIKECASSICKKYLNPPKTTDFGILYLPTEGLFAEVVRRIGLPEFVQRECRVVIAGPTTLWSILNSLQMGFKTLTIQKRSSEVWNLLAAVKTQWSKYGEILGRVQKKLQEASNTIDDAERRTRVIGRKLKEVQELPDDEAQSVLMLEHTRDDGELEGDS